MPFCFVSPNQDYTEEFREIAGKGKKLAGGTIADGTITLINQRHVGDDLPVMNIFFVTFLRPVLQGKCANMSLFQATENLLVLATYDLELCMYIGQE
jgi:hypothetical protein